MSCPGGAGAARSTSSYNGPGGGLETDAEPKKVHCVNQNCMMFFNFTEILVLYISKTNKQQLDTFLPLSVNHQQQN